MSKFLKTLLQFSTIVVSMFLITLAGYYYFDPFRVLYPYNNYSYLNVSTNRDYISTQMFLQNYPKYHYNSFIFGSSRTLAFQPEHWKNYLDKTDSPLMFDASGETCYGIYKKIKFLDSTGIKIKNALVVLCHDASFVKGYGQKGHLFIKDPRTSGKSKLSFDLAFLSAYYDPQFLLSYYTYKLTSNYKPWMRGYIENRKIEVDSITNQIIILDQEKEITENPDEYYKKRNDVFYKRSGAKTDTSTEITEVYTKMLSEIAAIFKKQNTNYAVILSPLYEQINFNPADMKILKDTFGDNLYDFTGENSFTENIHNYYEKSHYRPVVGDSIMQYIYSCKNNNYQ
ncbi:MAG: hypothetical protein ACXVC6_15375 [Bacteroidia bacterium]